MKQLLIWLALCLFALASGDGDDGVSGPIVNNNVPADNIPLGKLPESEKPHKVIYYLSNPWIIAVCFVVSFVLVFNVSMICYLQCSSSAGVGRPSFFDKHHRKGYSNVANVDSEDMSNSDMEQINIQ